MGWHGRLACGPSRSWLGFLGSFFDQVATLRLVGRVCPRPGDAARFWWPLIRWLRFRAELLFVSRCDPATSLTGLASAIVASFLRSRHCSKLRSLFLLHFNVLANRSDGGSSSDHRWPDLVTAEGHGGARSPRAGSLSGPRPFPMPLRQLPARRT